MVQYLAPHCHAARVGADLVLVDVARGVYFCLPDLASALQATPQGLALSCGPRTPQLQAAGLFRREPGAPAIGAPPPSRPCAGVPVSDDVKPRLRDARDLLEIHAATCWTFRFRSFGAMLRRAAARPAASLRQVAPLYDEVRTFELWLPWLPFQGECLLRSFLLLEFLRRRGHRVHWVFGVATWPFAAHCWLQAGDVVLNDHPGRLLRYTPILAV